MKQTFKKCLSMILGGSTKDAKYHSDLKTWAKTEYKNDWEFAYNYMILNNGKTPKATEYTKGITL